MTDSCNGMIDQGEMFEIANPCRGICEVNNKGYCKGCLRKREERFHWNEFSPFQQQLIVNLCGRRRAKAIAARQQAQWQAKHGLPDEDVVIPQLDMFVSNDSAEDQKLATEDITASDSDRPAKTAPESSQAKQSQARHSEVQQPQNQNAKPEKKTTPDQFDLF